MTVNLSVNEAIEEWSLRFEQAGHASPKLDARLLALHASHTTHADMIADPDLAFTEETHAHFLQLASRRLESEPIAYILGQREFWSMDFAVDRSTLVPRPDSEILIEAVLAQIDMRQEELAVLDLGTGSGCLLLALLSELPKARGLGIDVSAQALEVARYNARRHELDGRANFVCGDWASGISGQFDIIITNPPYITRADRSNLASDVVDFEPSLALFGGADGLDPLRAMLPSIKELLTPSGFYIMECGDDQAQLAGQTISRYGLEVVEFRHDLAGIKRCVVAKLSDS